METKKIEKVTFDYVYVASDGTEFDKQEQCEKYEKSATGVLAGRVKPLVVFEGSEDEVCGCGCCDNKAWVVVPKSEADLNAIKQFILCKGSWQADYVEPLTDEAIGKPIILYFGYENDECWFDTFDRMLGRVCFGQFKVEKVDK